MRALLSRVDSGSGADAVTTVTLVMESAWYQLVIVHKADRSSSFESFVRLSIELVDHAGQSIFRELCEVKSRRTRSYSASRGPTPKAPCVITAFGSGSSWPLETCEDRNTLCAAFFDAESSIMRTR